ncbi:MAG: DUF2085 domain-containing protein [Anaerolineaceae bacterium]|nr:DUF2085 domain-containing protein [Anaerolineaceae bacterium]
MNETPSSSRNKRFIFPLLGLIAVLLAVWFSLTPAGLEGKLSALGFAFCHQIEEHSLQIGGRFLPLCARCTGMYLGTLVGLMLLGRSKRAGGAPDKAKLLFLGLLALIFVIDGVNSTLVTLFHISGLYTPSNLLRLFSGLGLGMVIANVLVPIWNNVLWQDYRTAPVLDSWGKLAILTAAEGAVGLLVLTGWSWLYLPVALLSTLTIPVLLTMIYTLLWVMIKKKENSFLNWQECVIYIEVGFITTLVQIGLFDLLRWSLTGSWAGFQI